MEGTLSDPFRFTKKPNKLNDQYNHASTDEYKRITSKNEAACRRKEKKTGQNRTKEVFHDDL